MRRKTKNILDLWWGKIIWSFLVYGLGAWVISDLVRLESGEAESVTLWVPIIRLYEYFGFWPAVGILPLIGTVLFAIGVGQLIAGQK